nr:hypothetical protein [Aromatoleum aromaticum]
MQGRHIAEPECAPAVGQPERAVTFASPASLVGGKGPDLWLKTLGDRKLADWLAAYTPTHVYLGSEFCEHLIPTPVALRKGVAIARDLGCMVSLLAPIAAPKDLRTLGNLLPSLPDESEVIVSDWGTAYFVRERFPGLRLIAGRVLCRMQRDPRIPAAHSALAASFDPRPLGAMLARLGFVRMELDVPLTDPHAAFSSLPLPASVHVPFSCVAKGRMCRIGSTAMRGAERFAVGSRCRKECLRVSAKLERPGAGDQREVYQLGNSIISRISDAMLAAVMNAVESGAVSRLVIPGDAP